MLFRSYSACYYAHGAHLGGMEKTKTPPSHEGGISQLNTKLFLLTYLLSIFLLQSYGLFAS